MKKKKLFKPITFAVIAFAVVAALYLTVGCPIRLLTGISCLGCGMTRAWLRVLHLDFEGAFYYHPLWLLPAVFVPVWLWLRPKHRRLYDGIVICMIVMFVGAYVLRLLAHSPVLEVAPTQGLLYKAAVFLRDHLFSGTR